LVWYFRHLRNRTGHTSRSFYVDRMHGVDDDASSHHLYTCAPTARMMTARPRVLDLVLNRGYFIRALLGHS
jgi:hypothetical protein